MKKMKKANKQKSKTTRDLCLSLQRLRVLKIKSSARRNLKRSTVLLRKATFPAPRKTCAHTVCHFPFLQRIRHFKSNRTFYLSFHLWETTVAWISKERFLTHLWSSSGRLIRLNNMWRRLSLSFTAGWWMAEQRITGINSYNKTKGKLVFCKTKDI